MSITKQESSKLAARTGRNTANLRNWALAWVITCFIAVFGPKWWWDFNTLLSSIAVSLNLAVGAGMILSNRRYLQGLDELHRKIFLDACALSLGVGLITATAYGMLKNVKLIAFEPDINHVIILMCLTFLVGTIAGHRKYA